eukprot:TRINITY_DN14546_c0_g1_i1.p1 TRINITY_DN14546_c0_g1~~TRINITY_DN14546_c0_g1_i1.p1  ORF type:complete len:891 (-),score=136.25 TRINITY_DN14546_c0_g1_i1:147-2819(-)
MEEGDAPARPARRPDFPEYPLEEEADEPIDDALFYESSGQEGAFPDQSPNQPQPTQLCSLEHFLEQLTVQLEPVNVVDMIRRCQLGGRMYNDQSFTAEPAQIMPELKQMLEGMEWKRVSELRVAPQLFTGALYGGLIIQSETSPVEDGNLLGALGAIATRPDLLRKLFSIERSSDRFGIYTVRLHKNGDWHDVVVDDTIPTSGNKPAFGSCGNDNEMWIPIVEKAYAKLHRNYAAIANSSVAECLGDLTGGAVQRIYFTDPEIEIKIQNGQLWQRLMRYNKWGYVTTCKMSLRPDDSENVAKDWGILENYTYTILDVRQVNEYKLIHIRNPWGIKQWQGPWSDSAREWELKENQGVVDALGYVIKDDGTFWMAYQDFVKQFNKMYVTRVFPSNYDFHAIKEGWSGPTCGGPPNCSTWCANPQYRLSLEDPKDIKSGKVFISLLQRDNRSASNTISERVVGLGFTVVQCKGAGKSRLWQCVPEQVVAVAGPSKSREVCTSVRLEPSGKYMVVPHCARGAEGSFVLRLWSDTNVQLESVNQAHHIEVASEWKPELAGGRRTRTTWCKNPQFTIAVEKRSMVQAVLQRLDAPNMKFRQEHAIGLCVVNSVGEGKPAMTSPNNRSPKRNTAGSSQLLAGSPGSTMSNTITPLTAAPVMNESSRKMIVGNKQLVAESDYTSLSEGSLLLCMEEGARYVVVPSSYNPDIFGTFVLKFISSSPVHIQGMDSHKSVVVASKWEEKTMTCGGSHLNDSWDDCPQFQIRGKESGIFQVRLTRREEQWSKNNKIDPVGCMLGVYIFEGDEPGVRADLKQGLAAQRVILVPEFLPVHEVSVSVELPNPGVPYVIVPCTFAPGKEGPFLLEVTCETPFQLDRLRKPEPVDPVDQRRDSMTSDM